MESTRWLAEYDGAVAPSAAEQTLLPLRQVWTDLVAGRCKVVDGFNSPHRFYLVLVEGAAGRGEVRSGRPIRDLRLLEKLLLCGSQKEAGHQFGLSTASVAAVTKRTLATMGMACLPSKVPALLVLAAHAARPGAAACEARASRVPGPATTWVVSVPRADRELLGELSPAEHQVLSALVDGRTHAEIARQRRTSRRTVANQLANAFRRLNVSGRAALLLRLAAR